MTVTTESVSPNSAQSVEVQMLSASQDFQNAQSALFNLSDGDLKLRAEKSMSRIGLAINSLSRISAVVGSLLNRLNRGETVADGPVGFVEYVGSRPDFKKFLGERLSVLSRQTDILNKISLGVHKKYSEGNYKEALLLGEPQFSILTRQTSYGNTVQGIINDAAYLTNQQFSAKHLDDNAIQRIERSLNLLCSESPSEFNSVKFAREGKPRPVDVVEALGVPQLITTRALSWFTASQLSTLSISTGASETVGIPLPVLGRFNADPLVALPTTELSTKELIAGKVIFDQVIRDRTPPRVENRALPFAGTKGLENVFTKLERSCIDPTSNGSDPYFQNCDLIRRSFQTTSAPPAIKILSSADSSVGRPSNGQEHFELYKHPRKKLTTSDRRALTGQLMILLGITSNTQTDLAKAIGASISELSRAVNGDHSNASVYHKALAALKKAGKSGPDLEAANGLLPVVTSHPPLAPAFFNTDAGQALLRVGRLLEENGLLDAIPTSGGKFLPLSFVARALGVGLSSYQAAISRGRAPLKEETFNGLSAKIFELSKNVTLPPILNLARIAEEACGILSPHVEITQPKSEPADTTLDAGNMVKALRAALVANLTHSFQQKGHSLPQIRQVDPNVLFHLIGLAPTQPAGETITIPELQPNEQAVAARVVVLIRALTLPGGTTDERVAAAAREVSSKLIEAYKNTKGNLHLSEFALDLQEFETLAKNTQLVSLAAEKRLQPLAAAFNVQVEGSTVVDLARAIKIEPHLLDKLTPISTNFDGPFICLYRLLQRGTPYPQAAQAVRKAFIITGDNDPFLEDAAVFQALLFLSMKETMPDRFDSLPLYPLNLTVLGIFLNPANITRDHLAQLDRVTGRVGLPTVTFTNFSKQLEKIWKSKVATPLTGQNLSPLNWLFDKLFEADRSLPPPPPFQPKVIKK